MVDVVDIDALDRSILGNYRVSFRVNSTQRLSLC